jgi:transposase
MKAEVFNAHTKHMILKRALKEDNVSETCKLFGISRTTYYKWKRAYEKQGMMGLETREPKKPQMPNRVDKSLENEILSYVGRNPTDGPKRIYYELRSEGFDIGESGIYNVLRRHNLTRKAERREYAKSKALYFKGKPGRKRAAQGFQRPQEAYPGHLVIQRIDFIGTFEGIGRLYQYTVYESYSKWCVVKLFNRKQDIDIWYYFELKLIYLMKTFNLNIENLITVKTKEFVPYFIKGNKYREIMENFNINHSFIAPEEKGVLEEMGEFNELLVKEFYNKIGEDSNLDSFVKVERALQKFVRHYNFSRPIGHGCNAGKVPAEVVLERAAYNNADLETLPLWILALINRPKGGEANE